MVYGKKEFFMSRDAVRKELQKHGASWISPQLITIIVNRFQEFMDLWAEESLKRLSKNRKTLKAWHLQDYWDEEKAELESIKSAKCQFCGTPLTLDDICGKCYEKKLTEIFTEYDKVLTKAHGKIESSVFLHMTSEFMKVRRKY